jgi:cellulose synthase operon protein C
VPRKLNLLRRELVAVLTLCACAATAVQTAAAPAAAGHATAAQAVVWPPANQALIHNARFWEAHRRGDLAQLALKKLVAARPDVPAALLELGELDLRLNDFAAAAEVERELAQRFPGSSAAKDFAIEVRIATRDRLRFATIRRLMEIGRTSEAEAELKRLFPHGPPGGVLGIDYYLLLANMPRGFPSALTGMRRLAHAHPDDPRYELALAQLMVREERSALAAVAVLQQLSRRDDIAADDVDRVLASGLSRLGAEHAPGEAVSAYLVRHPHDSEMIALREEQERIAEERALLSPATRLQALRELQQRLAMDLSSGPEHVSGTGYAPSSGQVGVRADALAKARAEARGWLDRSRVSLDHREEVRSATELRAALAFYRGNEESEIGIARELESQGLGSEAGELLASAAQLEPKSAWLFETWMRWMIAHGQAATALELIRSHPPEAAWSAQSRDALLAAALDQRAAEESSAGHVEAAMADLEAAIELTPRDPWLRYRLAEDYRLKGEAERGRALMGEGVHSAPEMPDMRYAQALYLSHLDDDAAAYAAIDVIPATSRSAGMNDLRDRMRVQLARAEARRLKQAGDLAGARAALLDVEPLASHSFDRAAELAYSWIQLDSPAHGIGLVQPYVEGSGASDPHVLLGWAGVLNSAEDDGRLRTVLARLRDLPHLSADEQADVKRLQRALDLREIRDLERQQRYAEAGRHLDALLALDPQDRSLRVARAELDLTTHHPGTARDRLASLVAENPDDLDTRLSYVRALTESGDIAIARSQLQAVEARIPGGIPANDEELEISLARRQLSLGAPQKALRTLKPLLVGSHPRADVLMLAGRAELALHHLMQARVYFNRAAASTTGEDALAARRARQDVEDQLQSSVTAGALVWHQPGSPGMSQIDAVTVPSSWVLAQGDGSRFIARADAVWLNAGRWSTGAQPLLLGTIQAAGPGAALRHTSDQQTGLSPGVGYQTSSLSMDLGATPLGFLLPNVVGGVEWTPTWNSVDLTLGLARRAVTSSELSYAGLKDPVTGTPWGGVVETGPYAGFGIYRENYDFSGALRFVEITGTRVPDNQLAAARTSGSWKFWSEPDLRADAGVSVTYWNYERNLSNYTFGSGGYYSPESYVSVATPIELTGGRAGWTYTVRGAVSYTVSQVSGSLFYPNDPTLQAEGARTVLPAGYSTDYFPAYHSTGFGFSAYAAGERQLTDTLVLGIMLDIDRTDYYHPTSIGIYLRHAFPPWTTHSLSPPGALKPYNP